MIRGSDDFYPRDRGSHSPHIYANAFNGLMISNCGLQVNAFRLLRRLTVPLLTVPLLAVSSLCFVVHDGCFVFVIVSAMVVT